MKRIRTNEIPDKPRWPYVSRAAWKFLIDYKVNWLPLNPEKLFYKDDRIKIRSIEWAEKTLEKFLGDSKREIINGYDAETWEKNGRYLIIYNNNAHGPRIPFSICHEIGHVILNHLSFPQTSMTGEGLTDEEYEVLEVEADFFAEEILMPSPVLRCLMPLQPEEIVTLCNVSLTAATNKVSKLRRPNIYAPEEYYEIKQQLEEYIDFIKFGHKLATHNNFASSENLQDII